MMNRLIIPFFLTLACTAACVHPAGSNDPAPEEILGRMRAELSFHGTRAFSPDSMVVISFYAGFQAIGNEELAEAVREGLEGDGFAIEHIDVDDREFRISARSAGGIRYYARHLFADGDGVEYAAGVQFPATREDEAEEIIRMIRHFPLGPGGHPFRGLALR